MAIEVRPGDGSPGGRDRRPLGDIEGRLDGHRGAARRGEGTRQGQLGNQAQHDHRLTPGDLPGLAKVVAVSGVRIGVWATVTGLTAGRRTLDAVRHPETAGELAEDLRVAAAAITRALVGEELEGKVRAAAGANPVVRAVAEVVETVAPHHEEPPEEPPDPLHLAGQELLRRSRDVWSDDDRGHPAYARIIHELAPDEARILLLLLRKGPQPTVDIRTGGLVGTVSSTLVKANLNMIGALSGCRHVDRVPSYLHNLERLGLVWFSRETLRDHEEYQVLEVQPDVLAARRSVRRSKVVRRSIHLTPFGEDFCRDGLGLHLTDADREQIPRHGRPGED